VVVYSVATLLQTFHTMC